MAAAGYEEWLRVVSAQYTAPAAVYAAVDGALRRHSGLRPRTDYYREAASGAAPPLLIVLAGTLLCGGMHLVPVEVWLPHGYGAPGMYGGEAPHVYVRPAPGVPMRPTSIVAADGRVTSAVLGGWQQLADALDALAAQLGTDVPFYPQSGRPVSPGAGNSASVDALLARLARRYAALQSQLLVEANCALEEASQLADGEAVLARAVADLRGAVRDAEADSEAVRARRDAIGALLRASPLPADLGDVVDLGQAPPGDVRRLALCAEDDALSDAIAALFRAHFAAPASVPTADVLRAARLVARDQFMVRELLLQRYAVE